MADEVIAGITSHTITGKITDIFCHCRLKWLSETQEDYSGLQNIS